MFEDVKNCGVGKFISNDTWKHPDRIIDSYEIIFVTKGNVYINSDGIDYSLRKNDLLLLKPNVRHYGYEHSTDTEFFWLHWQTQSSPALNITHYRLDDSFRISLYFRQLLYSKAMNMPSEALDYLTRLILIEVNFGTIQINSSHIAEKIYAWIRANNNIPITDTMIAKKFGYNVDYLNKVFKSTFSKTIKQHINEERMKYIKAIILSDELPLKEVAEKAGFSDYKLFLKFFKYHEKITPTTFYKHFSKTHINSR